jgi:hypothetical protein
MPYTNEDEVDAAELIATGPHWERVDLNLLLVLRCDISDH